MAERPRLSVVIPLLDERPNLAPLHAELTAVLESLDRAFEIVYVDDASTDGTGPALDQLVETDRRAVVVHLPRRGGQALALQAGFRRCAGETVVSLDGDLQYDPRDIPRLLERLSHGFDAVTGWRVERADSARTRAWASSAANLLVRAVCGQPLRDVGCALRAFRREALEGLELRDGMHRFVPILLAQTGRRLDQVPVRCRPRRFGRSHYGWGRVWPVLRDIARLGALRLRLGAAPAPSRAAGLPAASR